MTIPTLDEILTQDDWLRRMARAIVHDPALADDLTQDAWVAALQRGRGGSESRPWLLGVLHHSARSLFRGEAARRARQGRSDSSVARDQGTVHSTVDVVADLDLRRRIAETLIDLEEPYRTALHLRYITGDTLPSVARKTGVSTSTAEARCARGVAKLRHRLLGRGGESAGGERARWFDALVVAAGPEKTGLLGAKGVLVGAAAGALGLAGWWGMGTTEGVEATKANDVLVAPDHVPVASMSEVFGMGGPAEPVDLVSVNRYAIAPSAPVAGTEDPAPVAPEESWLEGVVLLPDGQPAKSARVALLELREGAPFDGGRQVDGRAGAAGEFRLVVPSWAQGQSVLLVARRGGSRPYSELVVPGAKRWERRQELVLEAGHTVEGRAVRSGEPLADMCVGIDVAYGIPGVDAAGQECWWANDRFEEKFAEAMTDALGYFRFTGLAPAEHRVEFQEPNAPGHRLPLHTFQVRAPDERVYDLTGARLLVSVFDSVDRLEGARVRASLEHGGREWTSGPEAFTVEVPAGRPIRIEATHPSATRVEREVLAPGPGQWLGVDLVTVRIERPRLIATLMHPNVDPFQAFSLLFMSPVGGPSLEVLAVPLDPDKDSPGGRFVVEAVPLEPGPYLVSLEPGTPGTALSFRYPDTRLVQLPRVGDVEIELDYLKGGRCSIDLWSELQVPWTASYSLLDASGNVAMDGVVQGGDLMETDEFEVTDENFSSAWEVSHEFHEVSEGAETAATASLGQAHFHVTDRIELQRGHSDARARAGGVLRAGSYTLQVEGDRFEPLTRPIEITAGMQANVRVELIESD
ncbi:RNA polymerase sigma factor [Planctomycetes bacterium Poly30]|uniref:RNA polymerase sigma factor n=1 Tax=Saltatorellus ferox TaxID=2528018 RepID=A0A518EZ77_9BACT|nr:RNA polymerase sigma factor [Planctomycetes bacterium Poly30]